MEKKVVILKNLLLCFIIYFSLFYNVLAENEDIEQKINTPNHVITQKINKYFNLRLKFLYNNAKLDIHGKNYQFPNYGGRIELIYGIKIPTLPGLETGIGASFMNIGSDNTFEVDINPDKYITYNVPIEMTTFISGSLLQIRFNYNIDLGLMRIGIMNGFGIGFFYERNDWKLIDPNDKTIDLDGDLERAETIKPVLDFGLKIDIPINKQNKIGLAFGGLTIPVLIDIASDTTSYGIYKFEFIKEVGINWQVFF